ncbi:unnamed protein product [Brachionus calyciflorus]|uniref:Ribokinase n=1 Tax=Brachionus calyciflorus TaxID=104777 RepID=A0A814E1F0_9BILA|nr:unnamed protein product [Brachionus calyciflorus]
MSEKEFDVVSVGDCVIDCLFYVDRMPKMAETMTANSFEALPGGKGANVCIAGARLGSKNAFICKLGQDLFGQNFINILNKENLNIDHVTFTDKQPTSVASIMVDPVGNNSIAVNFGATLELSEKDIENAEELIKKCKVLITSMVVKEKTALNSLKIAKKHNLITVFNFAPAIQDLDVEFNKYVDVLVVNEVEAEVFTGSSVKSVEDAEKACRIVLEREGFEIGVVVTLGEKGCVFGNKKNGEIKYYPAIKVNVVDSTGAGDAFCGALAHFISKCDIYKAINLASSYASQTVTRKGTQSSYPYINDLPDSFRV